MDSGSTSNDEPQHGANGQAAGAATFDPSAYQEPGSAPSEGAAAPAPVQPIPDGFLASIFARLASVGIKDRAEVEAFRHKYGEELEQLFAFVECGDALAEYGITFGGDGGRMPTWARLGGAVGGAAVLLLMNRPELLERMRTARTSSSSSTEGEPDSAPDPSTTTAADGRHGDGGRDDAN